MNSRLEREAAEALPIGPMIGVRSLLTVVAKVGDCRNLGSVWRLSVPKAGGPGGLLR